MTAVHWCDGSSKKYRQWLIHDTNTCCLLISRVYKCENDHEVLGSHRDILSKFDMVGGSSLVLFQLYHKTGFTRPFMSFVTCTLNSGITLLELENLLIQNRIHSFYLRKQQYVALSKDINCFPDIESYIHLDILYVHATWCNFGKMSYFIHLTCNHSGQMSPGSVVITLLNQLLVLVWLEILTASLTV